MIVSFLNNYCWLRSGMVKLLTGVLLVLLSETVGAQDVHFSQFFTTPMLTNPANTGMSDNDLRFANNYRNQWSSLGVPMKTFYSSLDKKLNIFNQFFGIGGALVHDQSSAYNLTVNKFLLSLSYSKVIKNHQFTIGVQPGYVFKSYNSGSLTYGSQYDATNLTFNSSLASLESGMSSDLNYFDLNVGFFWRTLVRNIMPSVGLAFSHVTQPIESFSTSSSGDRLPIKLTLNSQVAIPLTERVDITPSMLFGSTSGSHELLLGSIAGYSFTDFFMPADKVFAIGMFRVNSLQNFDAAILGGGFKFPKFDLGLTYDFNVSALRGASNFKGAFEISLVFTGGNHNRRNINEPCSIY